MLQHNLASLFAQANPIDDPPDVTESLQRNFAIGQKVRVTGGKHRVGELCEVEFVTKKCVRVKALDGKQFLKKMNHVLIEPQTHTVLKREDVITPENDV